MSSVLAAGSLLLAPFADQVSVAAFLVCMALAWLAFAVVAVRGTGKTMAWTVEVSETAVEFVGPFLHMRAVPSDVIEVRLVGALPGRTGFKIFLRNHGVIRLGPARDDRSFLRALRRVNSEVRLPGDF